ncbi:MAG: hypothetical protein MI784_13670 [Cytophagales bacterium]|nr:hypothetical protein [Cytophagales bacterium]
MILEYDSHPDESLYAVGGYILKTFYETGKYKWDVLALHKAFQKKYPSKIKIPFHLFILGLDWLYLLNLVEMEKGKVKVKLTA